MDAFLEMYKLSKLKQEEIENLNMLSEISEAKKDNYHMVSLIYVP